MEPSLQLPSSGEKGTSLGTSDNGHETGVGPEDDVEPMIKTDVTDVLQNERDLVAHVVSIEDDPSLNPWTFRSFFVGIGLSAFGGVLGKFPSIPGNQVASMTAAISGNILFQAGE